MEIACLITLLITCITAFTDHYGNKKYETYEILFRLFVLPLPVLVQFAENKVYKKT